MSVRCFCIVLFVQLVACASDMPEAGPIEQALCQNDPNDPCCPGSPILLDLAGDGFHLTDLPGGVRFDLHPGGATERVSWTTAGSDDAWLALDRNGNRTIDNGTELFGNFTPQPPSAHPQGYLALAQYVVNHDDVIDEQDPIFRNGLLLWQDVNHDGVSQEAEMSLLAEHGIVGLDLRFLAARSVDLHGNLFRYSATVLRAPWSHVGGLSYDVFLITEPVEKAARPQGAAQAVVPDQFCGGSGGGDDGGGRGGIMDPSIFYKFTTIGGAVCRAVCWAAGSAVCAAVAVACAIGSTITVGGLVIPCTSAIIAACAAGNAGASICSDYVCPS